MRTFIARRRFSLMRLALFFALVVLAIRNWPPHANEPPIPDNKNLPSVSDSIEDGVHGTHNGQRTKASTMSGKIVFVSDGDSLDIRENARTHRVRLWGIDAPEGNTRQPFSRESRDYARRHAQDKEVRLIVHDTDPYGRLVGEVILPNGANLNRELVQDGWAWHFDRHAPDDLKLAAAQQHARSKRLGLWKDENPIPPWEWRRQHPARRN